MAETLKSRAKRVEKRIGEARIKLDSSWPDVEPRTPEAVWMPYMMRRMYLDALQAAVDLITNKTDEVEIKLPSAGQYKFSIKQNS